MSAAGALDCVRLSKRFGETEAVAGVDFSVPAGSFFSILGPSGCGKTTIMRMIAGFETPSGGDIRIGGRSVLDVAPNKRPVNMVFQHLALFPMMDVAGNVGYGLRRQGVARAEIARRVGAVLERVRLPGIERRKVTELSGGQRQRVAIARCMVLEPEVLLLDEPLGALDLKLRESMKVELKALQAEFDTTFVYITHDQGEALVMSDAIAVMNAGRFEQIGSAQDLYYRPATAFVAGFVGDANRFDGRVERVEGEAVTLRGDGGLVLEGRGTGLSPGGRAAVFVRPEAVALARDAGGVAGRAVRMAAEVETVLFNGAASRVALRLPGTGARLEAALPQTGDLAALARGDAVHVGWDAAPCFPA